MMIEDSNLSSPSDATSYCTLLPRNRFRQAAPCRQSGWNITSAEVRGIEPQT
jgi:hypothetical protein